VINEAEKRFLEAFEMWCWRRTERIRCTDRTINAEVLTRVVEERNIITAIMKRQWKMIGHVLRHGEELQHIIIEGITDRRKTAGRPRNLYISQLKKYAGVNIYVELAEDWEERKTKLYVINQPNCLTLKKKYFCSDLKRGGQSERTNIS